MTEPCGLAEPMPTLAEKIEPVCEVEGGVAMAGIALRTNCPPAGVPEVVEQEIRSRTAALPELTGLRRPRTGVAVTAAIGLLWVAATVTALTALWKTRP
jgi:hypothetical protein